MSDPVTIAIIQTIPTAAVIIILGVVAFRYRKQFEELLARIGSIKAFGVEAEFAEAREQLLGASRAYNLSPNEKDVDVLVQRANRLKNLLHGARLLWVDDRPLTNANIYRFLNQYGVVIDTITNTEDALDTLRWAYSAYDVIITDMVRGNDTTAGITLIGGMKRLSEDTHIPSIMKPVIIFVAILDPTKDTPAGARLITDSPIKLIHEVINVLETSGSPAQYAEGTH